MLNQIKVVLVETTHSGNIGSVARAMKTMQLGNLTLVNPKTQIDAQTFALAAGAKDIIEQLKITATFEEAISECDLVIGASARERRLSGLLLNPKQAAQLAIKRAQTHSKIAFVFGRERVGLTNEELQKCNYHLSIPANPNYSSLNLAMSVQIMAYELYQAALNQEKLPPIKSTEIESKAPISQNVEDFYAHLERTLLEIQFSQPDRSQNMIARLRQLFNRAQLTAQELNILRGILTAIEKQIKS